VLAIVDDNASAIDARLPRGKMTLAKFDPSFEQMSVVEGDLKDYVQYENFQWTPYAGSTHLAPLPIDDRPQPGRYRINW
jgi:hypothetical protein